MIKKISPLKAETVCGDCLEPNGEHTADCPKHPGSVSGN